MEPELKTKTAWRWRVYASSPPRRLKPISADCSSTSAADGEETATAFPFNGTRGGEVGRGRMADSWFRGVTMSQSGALIEFTVVIRDSSEAAIQI